MLVGCCSPQRQPELRSPGVMWRSLLLLSGLVGVSGFLTTTLSGSNVHSRMAPRYSAVMDTATTVSTEELVKLFGRLAEKRIFLDSSAGACCHSGCDGCPYRYDFDIMRAIRPKWVPTYPERIFDSDSHRAKWRSMFDDGAAATYEKPEPLTYEAFAERLSGLEYMPPLGTPVEVSDGTLQEETTRLLWSKLTQGKDQLSVALMAKRLFDWSNGGDSLMWGDFEKALSQ